MSNAQRIISSARSTCLTSFDKYLVERCKSRPGLSQRPHKKVSCTTSSAGTSIDIFPRWPRKVGIKIQDMSIGPLYTPQGNPLTAPPPLLLRCKSTCLGVKSCISSFSVLPDGIQSIPNVYAFLGWQANLERC